MLPSWLPAGSSCQEAIACAKHHRSVELLRCICPEPVLVNHSFVFHEEFENKEKKKKKEGVSHLVQRMLEHHKPAPQEVVGEDSAARKTAFI